MREESQANTASGGTPHRQNYVVPQILPADARRTHAGRPIDHAGGQHGCRWSHTPSMDLDRLPH